MIQYTQEVREMFEYEWEILAVLRENENPVLLEKVNRCKEVFATYQEVKKICNGKVCKILIVLSSVYLVLGFLAMQERISPIGLGSFVFGAFGMILSIMLCLIDEVKIDIWLDLLSDDDIKELNQILKKEHIQIIEKEEIVYLKRKKRVAKSIE